MDLITSLQNLLRKLEEDNLFLTSDAKEKNAGEEIFSYVMAYKIAKQSGDLNFMYEPKGENSSRLCQGYLDNLIKEKISREVVIRRTNEKSVYTSGKHTQKEQREKLELSIRNLCHYLGISQVDSFHSNGGQTYYRPAGWINFQSASNVIIDLSFLVASAAIKENV